MSLTSFVRSPGVMAEITRRWPCPKEPLEAQLLAPPRSKNYSLVGTAFDYLLRFELKRRNPQAVEREWTAENAVAGPMPAIEDEILHEMMDTLAHARPAESKFRTTGELTDSLLQWTIRTAHVDAFGRSYQIKPDFYDVDPEDVADLRQLYRIIPADIFQDAAPTLLNPVFPEASALIGGADCDLIAGDVLIDFKTTQHLVIKPQHWAQLLGYALLAERAREADPTFPKLDRVGIYFSRHGFLWTYSLARIFGDEQFPASREWFWQEVERQFGTPPAEKKPARKKPPKAQPTKRAWPRAKPVKNKKRPKSRGRNPKRPGTAKKK